MVADLASGLLILAGSAHPAGASGRRTFFARETRNQSLKSKSQGKFQREADYETHHIFPGNDIAANCGQLTG